MHALPSGGALHIDGPADAVPVLFLHGAGGGAWSWKPQREAFAASHRIFVWEARGHGAAVRVDDAGFADYFADAREALAAVVEESRRPAFIVGHSLGALFALALGSSVAAAVAGLFLIEPAYVAGDEVLLRLWLPFGRITAPVLGPMASAFARDATLSRKILRWMFERTFEDRNRMEAAWPDQLTQVPFEYPSIFREAFAGPKGFELRDFANEINDPTYILEGTMARRRPRVPRLIETLRERLGEDFTYEAVQGGHYLQLDRPDDVNERMRRFLEGAAR